ncbi:EAL domain-containing protein [Legionella pneumophila]
MLADKNHLSEKKAASDIIRAEQVELLYKQLPPGLAGEFIVSTILVFTLWSIQSHFELITWLIFTTFSILIRSTLIYCYFYNVVDLPYKSWLNLFFVGIVLTGCTWGYVGGFFIPEKGLVYQSFVVFMILGVSAAANNLYSPIMSVYILFLLISITPFSLWLFNQGNTYILLGFSSFIYIGILISTAYKTNTLLLSSLLLRFKNANLGSVKKLLEKKITEHTEKLNQTLAITRSTLESTTDGILVVSLENKIQFYNKKFLDMWKFKEDEFLLLDDKLAIEIAKNQLVEPEKFVERINDLYTNPDQNSFDELIFKDKRIFERYSMPNRVGDKIIGRVWSFRDVTERKKMEQEIIHQANHDVLTGLPNRQLLNDRIIQAINYSKRFHTILAVAFIDVDNFKYINDTFGHHTGDAALKEIAIQLKKCIRETDTLARFGGDEFVILVLINQHENVHAIINKINKSIGHTLTIHNLNITFTISIGISIYPKDGKTPSTLLRNADIAMYIAKNNGRNFYQLFDKTMHIRTKREMLIHSQLRNAIKNHECSLKYQPIFNLKTKKLIAVEALMRWSNPLLGTVNPDEFISIAENTGLIIQLGEWVLRQACQQMKAWHNKGLPLSRLAVNVSGMQIKRGNFKEVVKNVLNDTNLDPAFLELEITESIIMSNAEEVISTLKQLNQLGIHISIDDFGTGYSSFSYLKDIPANKLKIDKSFIQYCASDPKNASIVKAIIVLARQLNLLVLSEGVETREQEQVLMKYNCDEVQGFLYSPAVSPEIIESMLVDSSLPTLLDK